MRKGIIREFGMDMYTLLYLKWITNKDLLYSTWNSAQSYVAEFGEEWILVYVWLRPFAVLLKLSSYLDYTQCKIKNLKKMSRRSE